MAVVRTSGGGSVKLVVGIALGLLLGILSMFVARMAGRLVIRSLRREGATKTELKLRVLYFAALLWTVISLLLSMQVTGSVIRLVSQ